MVPSEQNLFPTLDTARYGENRRKRPLFLPNELTTRSQDKRLENAQDKAYEIISRWADLESAGKLRQEKEASLEAEFLTQVFGDALGYTLFSEGLDHWNLKPKFSVNGGQADAAIGLFQSGKKPTPRAVIELKGPMANVDRDKFNGRTAVQQCWDYLNALPQCPWGIVSNLVSFRLYHRDHTPKIYELFTLQGLREKDEFRRFYYLFQKHGLLPSGPGQIPRADQLLERTTARQREVGDELYQYYHDNRLRLIQHLTAQPHNKSLDEAIRIAQKLIDRIIFVAFCEDRNLLPGRSLYKAHNELPPFYQVTNPRWQSFLSLFRNIDEGSPRGDIAPYNGNLFKIDPAVDNLQLDDHWTDFFKNIGAYDFQHEVTVDILGHLFEKSINDIERIRLGGLWETKSDSEITSKMAKSAERKRGGIYYTPPEFTEFITYNTVAKLADEKTDAIAEQYGINREDILATKQDGSVAKFALDSIKALRGIKIVDPACGSGAFLIQAYELLEEKYIEMIDALALHDPRQAHRLKNNIPDYILHDNIFGVDLSPEAVEITQLALWLRSAEIGKSLADLSKNIVCGNSLIAPDFLDHPERLAPPPVGGVPDQSSLPDDLYKKLNPLDWQKTFPQIFSRQNPGFDAVIGNPPWERFSLKNREFFAVAAPHILEAPTAAESRRLIAELATENPPLYERYLSAKDAAEKTMTYIRRCGRFPLAGKGDINTYAVFAELARTIVSPTGRVGLLVPSGIASDNTTKDLFAELADSEAIAGLYDFENRKRIFPDIDSRYKFSVLLFGGAHRKSKSAHFVFFAHTMEDLKDSNRHISLSTDDFKLVNPNTRTCPVFRSKRDAKITKSIYRRVPVLIDKNRKEGGNPWGIKFFTMFHQSADAALFHTGHQLKAEGFKRDGPLWKKRKQIFLPLYEAKMIQMYDHRAASVLVDESNWMRQGQPDATSLVQHQNPEFSVDPRWWAISKSIESALSKAIPPALLAFKKVTSPTNQRTMIAAFIPPVGVIDSTHLVRFPEYASSPIQCCLLSNLNTFALDYVSRQKIGNVNLNFYLVEQFPMFPPDFYTEKCPWSKKTSLEKWISDRVLKLTCTSNDMIPFAKAAGFKPPVHKWNPSERLDLMAQLDAAYFLLYGIDRDDVEYILSTFAGVRKEHEGAFAGQSSFDRILRHFDDLKAESK